MIVTNKQDIQKSLIAKFPKFSRLDISFKDEYNAVADKDDTLPCDLSWGGLFIWLNYNDDLEISSLNGNFILKYTNIFTEKLSYSICGHENLIETLNTVFTAPELLVHEIENISQAMATLLADAPFILNEDRDSFDYILDADQQVKLTGTVLGKQRRKINKFIRSTGLDVAIREIDILSKPVREQLVNTMHTWDSLYSFGGNDSSHIEGLAINRAFIYSESIPLGCIGIYINKKLEGFTLFQKREQYTLIHHTKVSYNYPNLFDFAVYATISQLRTKGVTLINFEQDLGIEGLREHKLGLRPIRMHKKYTAQPIND